MPQSEKMEPVGRHDKRFDSPEPRPREEWEMWLHKLSGWCWHIFKHFGCFSVVILERLWHFSIIPYKIYKIFDGYWVAVYIENFLGNFSVLGRSFSDGFLVLRGSHQLLDMYRVRKVWDLHLLEFTLGKGGSDSLMALCIDVVTGNKLINFQMWWYWNWRETWSRHLSLTRLASKFPSHTPASF